MIALLPLWAMCDRWDIGGLSTNFHDATGAPTVFVYDGHPGGVGITERGFDQFEGWVADTARMLEGCPCEHGCPSCVQSPKCGNLNEYLDKGGALDAPPPYARLVIDPLKRVLVRAPRPEEIPSWQALGWRAEPDPVKLAAEHAAFCELLAGAGAEVVAGTRRAGHPRLDLRLRPGPRHRRRRRPPAAREAGAPRRARRARARPRTGRRSASRRTWSSRSSPRAATRSGSTGGHWSSAARTARTTRGSTRCARALPGVEVLAFDLPHLRGRGEVLHLLSLLSPLDRDLAVAYVPLLPVRLVELLEQRGVVLVGVPDDEFETMGANVLALGPRVGLAVARQRDHPAPSDPRRRRGARLRRRRALEGRRRPDLPHVPAAPRLTVDFGPPRSS